ncbi:monocyte to macrophage differentiation factor 2 [Caerostris extrusa]|uniref:Monocyte to macrophage differentiation factor 2 n=1 Tax=Caerostris extrusa TaxID=172846 RepID=A0AAV4S4K9_CAEEX|nr:monocyte to macrophage differentiation factor 2 [Caerostris extrusa]
MKVLFSSFTAVGDSQSDWHVPLAAALRRQMGVLQWIRLRSSSGGPFPSFHFFFHYVFYTKRFRSLKEMLHMCDRAIIYIFIAASYTPWLLLKDAERNFWTQNLSWIVWTMAILGIIYQYFFHER